MWHLSYMRNNFAYLLRQYSDSLRAGRTGGSNPGGGRDSPHPTRPALGPTQSPIQWVPDLSWEVKRPGAWR